MKTLTESVLRLAPPGGIFDETVIANLFPDATVGARRLLVHRAVSAAEVLRLKPGLFILDRSFRKSEVDPFAVAALLHRPSHVSLQSALDWHDLIPEAVFQVTSVTIARSREFRTPLGVFSYRRVPARDPRAGVEAVPLADGSWAYIATPLRAIADMVYLDKRVTWERDGMAWLSESLRMENEEILKISFRPLGAIRRSLNDSRTLAYLTGLRDAVKRGR